VHVIVTDVFSGREAINRPCYWQRTSACWTDGLHRITWY